MIDSGTIITDAQLLAAFDSGPVKNHPDIPQILMAQSCRNVAEMAIAAFITSDAHRNPIAASADRLAVAVQELNQRIDENNFRRHSV